MECSLSAVLLVSLVMFSAVNSLVIRNKERKTYPIHSESNIRSVSFTPGMYDLAAALTGHTWRRDVELEAIARSEADCSMPVTDCDWTWPKLRQYTGRSHLSGYCDYSYESGRPETSLTEMIRSIKKPIGRFAVGCALILECPFGYAGYRQPTTVLSCVFQDA